MLLTARELLTNGWGTTREEIRDYMSGNFCRCTGYQAIIDAIEKVAMNRSGAASR
jgi:carbon-monoxide dehydrogenase small subunit